MKTELQRFDGLDNRKDIMSLLNRLGSDQRRARFLTRLIPHSLNGFAGVRPEIQGPCEPVAAYFMLVSICNEVGVSINTAARMLEEEIRKGAKT